MRFQITARAHTLVALLALAATASTAQLTPEWIARFPVGDSLSAGTTGFHVDPGGVSYVTANDGDSADTDITTAAIDPDGNIVWSHTFNGPQNGFDQSRDITLAVDGTLWVTGNTEGPTGHADVLLLGYDAATGELTHTIQYQSSPATSESGHLIASDGAGSVYVVGSTVGDGTDVMTLKFDAIGQLVWRQTWDGPSSAPFSLDTGKAVAIDPNGDVVVALHGVMSSLHPDYVVVKYAAADGAVAWESNWGVSGGDFVRTLEIDDAGDVYVSGIGIDVIDKISTVKFRGSDGTLLWQEYDALGNDHTSNGLALDGEGGLVIAGSSDPEGDNSNFNDQFFVIKRDALTGGQLWTFVYGDTCVGCFDVPSDVEIDPAGNVFVPGETSSPPFSNDLILFVLDNATGLETDRGTSSGVGSEIPSSGLARFDGEFNLYLGGGIYNADTGANDVSVVKWSSLLAPAIPCADVSRFQARCVSRNGAHRVQFRAVFSDDSHDGDDITVELDGDPFAVPIAGGRAQMTIRGVTSGEHTLELTDPMGCFPPRTVTCQ